MKTFMPKAAEQKLSWVLIDAKGKTLGRLASDIAWIIMGKDQPSYAPHLKCGRGVVVINAKYIHVTGKKKEQMTYSSYSGYPGGLRVRTYEEVMTKRPTEILRHAVKGMLPGSTLGDHMQKLLRIFPEGTHTMQAQKPVALEK